MPMIRYSSVASPQQRGAERFEDCHLHDQSVGIISSSNVNIVSTSVTVISITIFSSLAYLAEARLVPGV